MTAILVHDIGGDSPVPCSRPKPCLVCVENDDPPFYWSEDQVPVAERIAEDVRRQHRHIRKRGGYVACTCDQHWDVHALHVQQEIVAALSARLTAVEILSNEWREESARFGWRRAAEYADDLVDVLCDWEADS